MAASVRIEDEAFSDLRFEVLALTCSLADADHARGKMAKIWRQCCQQQTVCLPAAFVVSVLGPNAVEALETAALGEVIDGGIRIRGARGRIEWLGRLRKNSRKGGRANAANWKPKGKPDGSPLESPAVAVAVAVISETESSSFQLTDQQKPKSNRKRPATQRPEGWAPSANHQTLASELGVDIGRELAKFRDWSTAKDQRYVSWDAAFSNWLRNARPSSPPAGPAQSMPLEQELPGWRVLR